MSEHRMRIVLVTSGLLLAGCMQSEPAPEMQMLTSGCEAGNMEACAAIANAKAADAERRAVLSAVGARLLAPSTQNYQSRQSTMCMPMNNGGMMCQ